MAVKLRLRRMGRRKSPIYGLVATDSRNPRDGKFIEDLGRYNPTEEPADVSLKEERVLYWLEQGAQPSDTVRSILSRRGLMLALHMKRKGAESDAIWEAVRVHRERHDELAGQQVKVTAKDRRRDALAAEAVAAAEAEAALAKARAEAEAKAKAEAEAAEAKARAEVKAEREAAAETARTEQEAKNVAQVAEDAAPEEAAEPEVEKSPEAVVDEPTEAAPKAEAGGKDATAEAPDGDASEAEAEAAADKQS